MIWVRLKKSILNKKPTFFLKNMSSNIIASPLILIGNLPRLKKLEMISESKDKSLKKATSEVQRSNAEAEQAEALAEKAKVNRKLIVAEAEKAKMCAPQEAKKSVAEETIKK